MINVEYLNDSISFDAEEIHRANKSFMESCKNDINKMFSDFYMLTDKVMLESEIMGVVPESMMMVYESEKKNIFARIGEMVVTIYNKFAEFIDRIIDKIKTIAFNKKNVWQKLDVLLKNRPDLKNETIMAINKGALDLNDIKSLKELDKNFDEILKMAKRSDVDPNSLRGKWEKAKKAFDEDEKKWKAVKIAAATTTILTAVGLIVTFKPKILQSIKDTQQIKQDMNEKKAKILEELKDAGKITEDTGKYQTLLMIWRELNTIHTTARADNLSMFERMQDSAAKFLDRFDKDNASGKRLQSDLYETKRKMDDRQFKEARQKAVQVAREEEARLGTRYQFNKTHPN